MGSIAKIIAYILFLITGTLLRPSATPKTLGETTASAVIKSVPTVSTASSGTKTMATPDELLDAINTYRNAHSLNSVTRSATLCVIAQSRANDQQTGGQLDGHAGFVAAAHSQNEFHHVGEILQYWDTPEDATYLVRVGWSRSGEHNAIMLDTSWTHGCGGITGYYSVFIFAKI